MPCPLALIRTHFGVFMPSGKSKAQKVGLVLGPVLFLWVTFMDLDPGNPVVARMAAVAVLMATWWITEAIPLFATALLPLVLFPLLGIERGGVTAPIYFNSTIVLFLGGFMIALTMEKVEPAPAHRPDDHPDGRGRPLADRAGFHGGVGLPLHVDLQYGHRDHDGPNRARDHPPDGG